MTNTLANLERCAMKLDRSTQNDKIMLLKLTKSMEHSPSWEPNRIPDILWNTNVHYHVHNSPQLVHHLSQVNPVHNLQPYLFKKSFNSILPSTPRSSK
jgi:hypothetical protein